MAGFLYFLPGYTRPTVPVDELARLGLTHLLDGDGRLPVVRPVVGGPGGGLTPAGGGAVIAIPERLAGRVAGYHPDAQEWPDDATEIAPEGQTPRWRLGWWKDSPPTPEDLAKKRHIEGYHLDDGAVRWTIPLLRRFVDEEGIMECALPRVLGLRSEGWVLTSVRREYRSLWDRHLEITNPLLGASTGVLTTDLYHHTAELLAANYTVGPVEIEALEFDEQTAKRVVELSCDYDKVVAYIKKNLHPTVAPDSGDEGSSAITDPPPAT
jgi:hypothetical protein